MKRDRGSALLIVLWLLVLVSAIAVSMSVTTRTESHLTFNLVEEARARYLAQAGINHAVLTLLDPQGAGRRVMDGAGIRPVDLFGATLNVGIRDECGKVDLNTAWGGLIRELLAAHGERRAVEVSQAILDWRDPDRHRRLHGAEDDDYAAAGFAYGARDGLFETIEELQQVRGMTGGLYRRLASDVTVDCLAAGIDPLAASPAVLAALPDVDRASLEIFLGARRDAVINDREIGIPAALMNSRYVESSPGQVYGIRSTVDLPSGTRLTWQAVVWLTGDPARPFLFRSWRRVFAAASGGEDG